MSANEECLCYKLSILGLHFKRQIEFPVIYKGVKLDCGYRTDLLIEEGVVVELKMVEQLLPTHEAER
ncbi:MAG: GxxExxY protein [bacterium]